MEQQVLRASYADVYFIPEKQRGKIVWHGPLTKEDYTKPFLTLIDPAKKGNVVTRFLSDIREQGVVSPESRKWFEKEMVPAAVGNGLKRAAVVQAAMLLKCITSTLFLVRLINLISRLKSLMMKQRQLNFCLKNDADCCH